MSVLIKGMNMPRSCGECRAICSNGEEWRCGLIVTAMPPQRLSELRQYCPLVEVPTPHGALIDRDKWIDEMREKLLPLLVEKYGETDALKGLHFSFLDCIENAYNADVVIEAEMIHDRGRS